MKSCESTKNAKLLSIKPAFNRDKATFIAILDEEKNNLLVDSLLFADNHIDLAKKARKFWDDKIGKHKEPKTLYIEYPQTFLNHNKLILDLFCMHIENEFCPMTTLRKRNKP